MVTLPAGSMTMGSTPEEAEREGIPAEYAPWERPAHAVTFARPFAIARTEITRAQYAAFAQATATPPGDGCSVWDINGNKWDKQVNKNWRDPGYPQTDQHPAVCISWSDAKAYAAWLSGRTGHRYQLQSEAQFEYAARGGQSEPRFWGTRREAACLHANVRDRSGARALTTPEMSANASSMHNCDDDYGFSAPVASFKPNPYGLYDIIGNAVEWTADCANDNYRNAPADGSAWISGDCSARLERGGSWIAWPWVARANRRHWTPVENRLNMLGFRVVRSVD
jgi:formylglycine-generating enzyme required for sulfatase activity